MVLRHLCPLDPGYPPRLRAVRDPPATITLSGGSIDWTTTVAIVGSREATGEACEFARALAAGVVGAGGVVVSGGAVGIDAAAHKGALDAGGRTWAIAGTGHRHCFPLTNAALFERIGAGPSVMMWPFAPQFRHRNGFLIRNRFLVALADAVVVVQAGPRSGALRAASWARRLGKPLWVVPASPWAAGFEGSHRLLEEGARPLVSAKRWAAERLALRAAGATDAFDALMPSPWLGRPRGPRLAGAYPHPGPSAKALPAPSSTLPLPGPPLLARPLSPNEIAVFNGLGRDPLHLDAIASLAALAAPAANVALLTLALEDVVVEGPPGFFRRRV